MTGLKVWNGSAFVDGVPKVWNGGAFVNAKEAHIWDGTKFVKVWPSLPEYVGGVYQSGTTTTVPTHQSGDLLVLCMFNTQAVPTLNSGWTRLGEYGQSFGRFTVDYKIGTGSETLLSSTGTVETITVYRGATAIALVDSTFGSPGPITYPAASGPGVLARVSGIANNQTSSIPALPTGTTARVVSTGGTNGMRWSDTESGSLSAFTGTEGTGRWASVTLSIT